VFKCYKCGRRKSVVPDELCHSCNVEETIKWVVVTLFTVTFLGVLFCALMFY